MGEGRDEAAAEVAEAIAASPEAEGSVDRVSDTRTGAA